MITYDWGGAECTAEEWLAWIKAHPRFDRLRRFREPGLSMVAVYDLDAFEADQHHKKSPVTHAVAYRQLRDGVWRYIVKPETVGVEGV